MFVERALSIGALARAAGIATSAVRYYERVGLVRPEARTAGNYRVYGTAALERLRFIRAAQANGFSLDDIAALLAFRDGRTAPCREVQTLIEGRLAELERRAKELRHVRGVLTASLKTCRAAERTGKCEVIETLRRASSSPLPGRPRGRRSSRP